MSHQEKSLIKIVALAAMGTSLLFAGFVVSTNYSEVDGTICIAGGQNNHGVGVS